MNPKAGAVKDLGALLKQLDRLEPAILCVTADRGEAESCARRAVRSGHREIVAAGGDGTLNEVINGVAGHVDAVRVGLIPLGTGNDFARSLDLPDSVEDNIDIVLAGKTRPVNVVRLRARRIRYFINVSTGGFSGVVDEKLTPEIKQTWGSLAYLRSAAEALPELHSYRATVVLDGRERLSLDLYNVAIANGRYVAGGLPIAPDADPTDGLLDVVLIPKRSGPEMALLAAEILLGKHLSGNMVIARRARMVALKSRPGMCFNVDGELVGNTPATFQVLPRKLNFMVGQK